MEISAGQAVFSFTHYLCINLLLCFSLSISTNYGLTHPNRIIINDNFVWFREIPKKESQMLHKRVKSWTSRKLNTCLMLHGFYSTESCVSAACSVTGISQVSQQSLMHFLKAREQFTANFFHIIIKVWMKLKPCQLKILNRYYFLKLYD